ncbi:MAG: adenylosuccinate lyase [Deltaproteobacteria bacterium]|nr:adenylosuccinate lyase [Deltaproteobacteria bacterium]
MIERYSRKEMVEIWSDRTRYESWLEVELAVCRAMEGDLVPVGTADRIRLEASIDPARIAEIETETRHDVIAFLSHIEEQAGGPARWLHLGLTSSDVLDTAFALQLKRAGELILDGVEVLLCTLAARAQETKTLAMVGRTHGIHAEPTTVGLVFGGYYAELRRHTTRLAVAVRDIARGKIAGAVGTYANVGPEVEKIALSSLGLEPETCATQIVPRDRHAHYFSVLAGIAGTIEKMSVQVRHWQRTEVGEARESFGKGQKGSSAMPHKRNPILSENLTGLARLVRSYASAALENVALWHERDISHSSVERVIAPDATTLVHFMLARMESVMAGLVLDEARIATNLQHTGGLIFSQRVMLDLVRKGLARQRAYELVQRNAMAAQDDHKTFADLLAADSDVRKVLSPEEIDACFDLRIHLQHVGLIFERIFEDQPA